MSTHRARSLARWLSIAMVLILTTGSGTVQATWSLPQLVIVGYQLVEVTPEADGVVYTFRARLFTLGRSIPGAVARLSGGSKSVTVLDDRVSFGPIGHLRAAWSLDTAAIRLDGTIIDVLSTLRWSINPVEVNQAPVADAGPDQSARVADRVSLDGSGSTDPDGDALTYHWSWQQQPQGSTATLSDASAVRPEFTLDVSGRYVVSLVVSDGQATSPPDIVEVTTGNAPPTADAGTDTTVALGSIAGLDGSGSSDPDGDTLAFFWEILERPPASQASLDDPAEVRPRLPIDAPGRYVVQLTVSDGQAVSVPDVVVLRTDNTPPHADAGPDHTVPVGQRARLDGSASSDVDGDVLAFSWALLAQPVGSSAQLEDATSVTPSFVADVPGAYIVQLVVSDGVVESTPDTVTISTANSAPVADAGPDQTVGAGQVAVLDASGSSDPDGDVLTYRWMLTARPAGSVAALADPQAAVTSFVADLPGTYVVQLVVNDGTTDSATDTAVVSTVNSVPVANAGPDQADVPIDEPVSLDGSASSDADGHVLQFAWSLIGRPSGSLAVLSAATTIAPQFVPDVAGDYIAQLIVNDGFVASAPDTVRISAANAERAVTIVASDAEASESGDTGAFVITRTGDLAAALVVNLQADGTATTGSDYVSLPGAVTIPALASSVTLTVTPIDDADLEGVEGVDLRLLPGSAYTVGTPAAALVTIADDDTLVSVVATDAVASEDGLDPGTVTLSRLGSSADALTVFLSVSGTATPGMDYVALSASASFPAGASETTLTITPLDDAWLEGPESVVVRLLPGAGYRVGALDQATITLQDDERPAVTVVVSDATAGEAGPDAGAFSVGRTGPTATALTVLFSIAGTATQGLDYESLGTSVTIPAGASSAPVVVTPLDDSLVEGAESVILTLAGDPAYVVVTPGIAAMNIADDDLGVVTIEATDPAASEAGLDAGLFTLRRTGDTTIPLIVRLAVSGSAVQADYQAISQLATIPAGASTLAVAVTPRADNLVEGSEEVTVSIVPNLEYVVGTPAAATVTIADDPAIVSIVAAEPDAFESGLVPGVFVLTRQGGDLGTALHVAVSIGGTALANRDYVVLSGVATIPAGEASLGLLVVPIADNLVDPLETVVVTILPATGTSYVIGTPAVATVTIADDPPVVQMSATDAAAAEAGLDPGLVTFARAGGDLATALNVFFTKAGTAGNGADYESLGGAVSLVVIPAGQSSASVSLVPRADNLVEGPETAVLTLSSNAGYVIGSPATASVTIDDDPPVVSIVATDPDASEEGPDTGSFTFTRSGGNLSSPLTVTFTRTGTATNVTDIVTIPSSITIPAGQASFTLTITPIDDGNVEGTETVTLTVTASGTVVVGAPGTATVSIADND